MEGRCLRLGNLYGYQRLAQIFMCHGSKASLCFSENNKKTESDSWVLLSGRISKMFSSHIWRGSHTVQSCDSVLKDWAVIQNYAASVNRCKGCG